MDVSSAGAPLTPVIQGVRHLNKIFILGDTMAAPKVFISSTCFDLGEVRDSLRRFVQSFGFDPILSEYGDVFYHPDLHTHEACINEISNCQLFILIIGGRFGGRYQLDKNKSITNAEYEAAKSKGIPIFTYVKSLVLQNHHFYQNNKKNSFVNEIDYPAIEKQENAADIFELINEIRRSSHNNSLEAFDNSKDIEDHIRKQWSGMFFDFLKNREFKEQITATNHLLSAIETSSSKLEELVKNIYRRVDDENAEKGINLAEARNSAIFFFKQTLNSKFAVNPVNLGKFSEGRLEKLAIVNPEEESWHSYLVALGIFKYSAFDGRKCIDYIDSKSGCSHLIEEGGNAQEEKEYLFKNGIKKLNEEERKKVISVFLEQ